MQKIRYNFRQTDDPVEMNEHFLALSSTGVKFGFSVKRTTGLELELAPGGLMTKTGVTILETEPIKVTMTAVPEGTFRNDWLVAEYEYAETNPPNSCTYKMVEGVADAVSPIFPGISANQYPIAKIKLGPNLSAEQGFTAILDIEQVYSNTRIDLPIDGPVNRTVLVDPSYDAASHTFSINAADVILDKVPTSLTASTVALKSYAPLEREYTLNSGESTMNLGNTEVKFNSRVYLKNVVPTGITSIIIKCYASQLDADSATLTTINIDGDELVVLNHEGKLYLPCQDIHSIVTIEINGISSGTVTVGLNRLCVLALVTTGSLVTSQVRVLTAIVGDKFIDQNNCTYSKNRCSLIAILDGNTLSKVAMLDGKYIYKSVQKDPGFVRLYHFLGHSYYSVGVTGIENVEVYNSNIGIVDRTGAITIYKGANYTTVYYTGSDTTKFIECVIDFGGMR